MGVKPAVRKVQSAIRQLGIEREVIELCVWSGLDQRAAATALGVAVGTVKSRLFRARRRLGAELAESAGSAESAALPELAMVPKSASRQLSWAV